MKHTERKTNPMIANEEMLRAHAPAAFAQEPEEGKVSGRYAFLPTTEILSILQDEGWTAWKAQQVNSRTWSKGHAKHIIRLRHEDIGLNSFDAGDSFPELLLINAHNGCGGYTLQGGVFRMICSNGMVISENDFGKVSIRHIGFKPEQVISASKDLIAHSTKVSDKINSWQAIDLEQDVRSAFFREAAEVRFGDNPDGSLVTSVSTFRREADNNTDLWSSFNIAQENLIRGGYRNASTRRMVRPITNIQKDINLNSQLWDLASKYSEEFSLN